MYPHVTRFVIIVAKKVDELSERNTQLLKPERDITTFMMIKFIFKSFYLVC